MMTYVDVVVVTSLTNNCLGREMEKGERLSSSSSDKLTIFLHLYLPRKTAVWAPDLFGPAQMIIWASTSASWARCPERA